MFISRAVSYFYEAEFEFWTGFGPDGQFIVHGFLILSIIYVRLIKKYSVLFHEL